MSNQDILMSLLLAFNVFQFAIICIVCKKYIVLRQAEFFNQRLLKNLSIYRNLFK